MAQSLVLPAGMLSSLTNKTLFYPCSGEDWRSVVQMFAPEIKRFWFVDICYKKLREERTPTETPSGLIRNGPVFIEQVNCEDAIGDSYYRGESPFIRSEQFCHRASNTPIEIKWYMRRGPSALRHLVEDIGIFLYRRDSSEGGSGTEWLVATKKRGQFREVLDHLVDGGLIATDGSNPGLSTSNTYAGFSQFLSKRMPAQDAAAEAKPFSDYDGNRFTCVGYIDCPPGRCKGPVLIWQFKRGIT